ncbi:hypothetical protein NSK11_contig00058-0036 [Nocardia seriolae]|uniref:Uncharacterized protein n=2 Tax=Nocardia seriolae TaxID=37332 RepID=A0ABC9YVX8_9NOCA|nr:hypothetical protein NS07_v2contig00055-0014 [Nocardia seriolae]GAP29542.1 hypothetical protein NSK11_contig00058-0036 [Nocardia seriolae]GEM25120.1 hypothetical protein NS2_33590 [Nocardia seriolae NBRC 15557]
MGILPCVAMTRQLARIPTVLLAKCRESVQALDTVCSFTAVPDTDYLDLDWWPLVLVPTWKRTGADQTVLEALSLFHRCAA